MRPARLLEAIIWSAGFALLAGYAVLRVSQERGRVLGIEAFEEHRSSLSRFAPPHSAAIARSDPVDQSLWSPSRVRAFNRTALDEVPQGVLRIPALHIEVPIYPGTSESELDRGAGHIEGTASLDAAGSGGIPGNVGIAAHRDGFFRRLEDARPGQLVYLETLHGNLRYRVVRTQVVMPSEISVLAPTTAPYITLVTCYPFYFVGSAPQRFIVQAEIDQAEVDGAAVAARPTHGLIHH